MYALSPGAGTPSGEDALRASSVQAATAAPAGTADTADPGRAAAGGASVSVLPARRR